MRQATIDRWRRLVAVILTVGLSVCCCQAHLLFAGWAHPAGTGAGAVATAADSCCDSCPDEPGAPADDRPAPTGCQVCCIKGTGLEGQAKLAVPAADVLLTLTLPCVVVAPTAPAPPALRGPADASTLRVDPPTLLRLRCALVV